MQNSNGIFDFFKMHTSSNNCIFSRIIGVNNSLIEDLLELDKACYNTGIYKRIDSLPKLVNTSDSDFYIQKYEAWINSKKRVATTKNVCANHIFASKMGKTIVEVLNEYSKLTPINNTLEKNFVTKLLFWYDFVIGDHILTIEQGTQVKIICENIKTKNEYLFFYFLKMLGVNILLLQTKDDIGENEKQLNLSNEIKIGNFSNIDIPKIYQNNINEKQANTKTLNFVHPNRKTKTPTNPLTTVQNNQTTQIRDKLERTDRVYKTDRTEKTYEQLADLASSVVMITTYNGNGEILGTGSGIIIGQKGYILTNCHVIAGGVRFSVKLENDDTEYQTDRLIKYHSNYDLAVLSIDKLLCPIPIYKGSNKLVRGQKVVAIGSPLGLFNSVSDGIISGFRNISNIDMIQFTAPISAGSSGGAVLNIYGEVIGISTAGMNLGQNLNLAVGYEYINDFIGGFIN